MDDSTHVEPPVPTEGAAQVDLVARAGDLWRWAGQPAEAALRSLMGTRPAPDGPPADVLPAGTVQAVLDGRADLAWDTVEPFVVACLRSGRRTQEQIALDLATWRTAWAAADEARIAAASAAGEDREPDGAAAGGSVADALAGPPPAPADPVPADEVDSEAPTVVHPRPVLYPTVPQPTVPPPPPPQNSLGDALFGTFPEPPPPPPAPPADNLWAPVPPRGRSRRLPVLAAAAVGVIALVAGGVAVAATRGGGTTDGRSTAAVEQADSDPGSSLPPGLALPADGGAGATSGTPTPTATPTGSATPTGTATPASSAGGGRTSSAPTGGATSAGGTSSSPAGGSSTPPPPPPTTAPKTTTPADSPTLCTTKTCAGSAYFVSYGEHLHVCDNIRDGYAAVAQYTRSDVAGNNVARDDNGSGTCIDHNMDMPEGAKITFRVCLGKSDGTLFNCSAYYTATA